MPVETSPQENRAAGVAPSAPWRVTAVSVLPDYHLAVTFVDGTRGIVDLSALVASDDAGIFAPLRDPAIFEQACVELGAVTWPNGADLAPDAMHDEIQKSGEWRLS